MDKEPGVCIVIIAHKPDKNLDSIKKALKKQVYSGKVEVKVISRNAGLAENMNFGLKNSKYEIGITLHGDCIPIGSKWLRNLVAPFKDGSVVATTSKVKMPEELWESMNVFNKALSVGERGTITPALDEKGCAYRKSALKKVGFFDEIHYQTAGEDMDMYIKLIKVGKIVYPDAVVLHNDYVNLKRRLKKVYRNAEGGGALIRRHGLNIPEWYKWMIKGTPIIGFLASLIFYLLNNGLSYYVPKILIAPVEHIYYIYGFWKGIFKGKQRAYIIR